jgi:hypothetical protein
MELLRLSVTEGSDSVAPLLQRLRNSADLASLQVACERAALSLVLSLALLLARACVLHVSVLRATVLAYV